MVDRTGVTSWRTVQPERRIQDISPRTRQKIHLSQFSNRLKLRKFYFSEAQHRTIACFALIIRALWRMRPGVRDIGDTLGEGFQTTQLFWWNCLQPNTQRPIALHGSSTSYALCS